MASEYIWRYGDIVSIHAFRGEGDRIGLRKRRAARWFQSTPSGGKATGRAVLAGTPKGFQSTPSGGKATVAD